MSKATDKMRAEGLPEIAIETFARYEERLRAGEQGLVPERGDRAARRRSAACPSCRTKVTHRRSSASSCSS